MTRETARIRATGRSSAESLVAVPALMLEGLIQSALVAGTPLDPVVKLKFAMEHRGRVLCDDGAAAFAVRIAELVAKRFPSRVDAGSPTPETAAKRTRDPVEWLMRSLSPAEIHAACLIRACREAMARGLDVSAQSLDQIRVDGCTAYRDPIDRLTGRMAELISHVYLPWARDAGGEENGKPTQNSATRLPLTPFDLVTRILMDRIPMRSLEQHHGMRSGSLSAPFRASLVRFDAIYSEARISGLVGGQTKST